MKDGLHARDFATFGQAGLKDAAWIGV